MATTTDSIEERRAGPQEFGDEVYGKHDLTYIDERYTDDWVGHIDGEDQTRDEYREMQRQLLEGVPDASFTFDPVIVEGDMVAGHWEMTGTHTGTLIGLGPTGRPVHITGTFLVRYDEDGKVAETWQNIDHLTMFQQLGIAPREFTPRELLKTLVTVLRSLW